MKMLFACLLATLLAFSGYSQSYSTKAPPVRAGQPVTLSWAQVVRSVHRADSLKQLATVRGRQAAAARQAATYYRRAYDSLDVALGNSRSETARLTDGLATTNVLLVSQTAKTAKYRARAHRKGWLNVVLAAAVAGLIYSHVAR